MAQTNTNRIFEEQFGPNRLNPHIEYSLWQRLIQKISLNRLDAVSRVLPNKKMSVLEIGCGDGTFLFNNRHLWKHIRGVDIVSSLLKKARSRKYGCFAKFSCQDAGRTAIKLQRNSVNVCISISALQYLYDIDILFEEIHRVLKSGGLWVFEVPNIVVFWRRILLFLGRIPRTSHYTNAWDAGTIHYFTYYNLKNFCEEKGFTVECVRVSGVLSTIRSVWPDMLGADLIFVCRKK